MINDFEPDPAPASPPPLVFEVTDSDVRRTQEDRQRATLPGATRTGQEWTTREDAELQDATTDRELEDHALRWHRTFDAVVQRRQRPRASGRRFD